MPVGGMLVRTDNARSYDYTNSIHQLVNASDLDRWVKEAEEYQQLYLQAQSDLENQAERYEQIISLMKTQSLQCERIIADLA